MTPNKYNIVSMISSTVVKKYYSCYSSLSFTPLNTNAEILNRNSCWKCKNSFLDVRMGLKCKKYQLRDYYPKNTVPLLSNTFEYAHRCRLDEKCGYIGRYFESNSFR
jgi:hypothetical protein